LIQPRCTVSAVIVLSIVVDDKSQEAGKTFCFLWREQSWQGWFILLLF